MNDLGILSPGYKRIRMFRSVVSWESWRPVYVETEENLQYYDAIGIFLFYSFCMYGESGRISWYL